MLLIMTLSRYGLIPIVVVGCGGTQPAAPPAARPSPPVSPALASDPRRAVPPIAERRPHDVVSPNGSRNDPYYWMRDDARKDPAVLAYLAAENAYVEAMLGPHKALEDAVFAEMRSHIKEDDTTAPLFDDGYWYYERNEAGKQHPIFARKKATLQAAEEIVLDGNELAKGHAFYKIGGSTVSRDGKLVAWAEDTVGRNQFALRIKNLATGELYPDTATNIGRSLVWANDNKTLFYTGKDPTTLRSDRVLRHVLGGGHDQMFKEDDGSYYVEVERTKSKRYVIIDLSSTTTSEARLIDADKPTGEPRVFIARSRNHLYDIDHLANRFVMRTNADAKNFRLVEIAPGDQTKPSVWKDLIPHRSDALVESFALYSGFVAASVRTGGLRKIEVVAGKQPRYFLDAPDPTYAMTLHDTPDANARSVRYEYDSLQTPTTTFEVDVATKQRTQLKQQPVPAYDAARYATEYLHATASDGTKVPISVVYRKDTPRDGTAPLLLAGYGSYGFSMEPRFASSRLSLLDRGWICAIAHIRGGQEMGRSWYEDGKLANKMNTFTDFIAVTEHLVATRHAARDQVFAVGGSAGGLLMGAIVNLRPELYRGIVAAVPFVDVVTTMLDESIPLTTNEFDEWGNPKDKAAYHTMLAYSPYDNVKPQRYPAMFVRTGLWDSQVQYFEPAKWVAKLRATKTDDNVILFETDMTAGHSGAAGRFDALRQTARWYTFLLQTHAQ